MSAGQAHLGEGTLPRFERRVNANADLDSLAPRFAIEAREVLQHHLAALFAPEPSSAEQAEASMINLAQDEPPSLPTPLPNVLSEREHEELTTENTARHDWIAQDGRQQREVRGSYARTADFRISTTDPDATPMRLKGGGTHLGYHTHYVVDGGTRRIILAVLVVGASTAPFLPTMSNGSRATNRPLPTGRP